MALRWASYGGLLLVGLALFVAVQNRAVASDYEWYWAFRFGTSCT